MLNGKRYGEKKVKRLSLDDKEIVKILNNAFILTHVSVNGYFDIVNIVTNCFEPILLCCILRSANSKVIGKRGLILTCFFIVECLAAIYEASTRSILFASLEDDELLGMQLWTMRAYSLHGHPLSNGAIVSVMSLF